MFAIICDRCQLESEAIESYTFVAKEQGWRKITVGNNRFIHLCPDCIQKFWKFLKKNLEKERQVK